MKKNKNLLFEERDNYWLEIIMIPIIAAVLAGTVALIIFAINNPL